MRSGRARRVAGAASDNLVRFDRRRNVAGLAPNQTVENKLARMCTRSMTAPRAQERSATVLQDQPCATPRNEPRAARRESPVSTWARCQGMS